MRLSGAILLLFSAAACFSDAPPPIDTVAIFPAEATWTAELGAPASTAPAYSANGAFVPLQDGSLVAVDLANGAIRWSIKVATTTAPAAGDGLVFAATAEAVEVFSETDGTSAWRLPLEGPVTAPLYWQSGWLFVSIKGGSLLAVRAADGLLIWRREFGVDIQVPPAAEGPDLFVPLTDGRVISMTVETGQPVWERKLGAATAQPLALPDRVFVGSADNFFYCLDRKDGDVKWRWRTGADLVGAPVVDDDHVYFVSLDNILRALDRGNGTQRWRMALPLRPFTGPLLIVNVLVTAGLSSTLQAYQTLAGADAGDYVAEDEIAAPPHVVFDQSGTPGLVIVTGDARIHRLGRGIEPPLTPLRRIPGQRLEREPPPELPETVD